MAGFDRKFPLLTGISAKKTACILAVPALVITVLVFLWLKLTAITVTDEALCGLSEHSHGNDCFVSELICGYETEENASVQTHSHTDSCYKTALVCELPEHIHSSDCFSDKAADTETESDWLKTFENAELTDSAAENLLAIALTQEGYEESSLNYSFDENGSKNGYTRYGEWYGNPYGKWNAMFVSFCLSYAEINGFEKLIGMSTVTMCESWKNALLYEDGKTHTAERGELIFMDTDSDDSADSVGIVTQAGDEIRVILGDSNGRVEIITPDANGIIGYGLTGRLTVEQKNTAEEETSEDITASDGDLHGHTEDCYTSDGVLVCTQWGLEEPWALDRESEEFRDKAVKYVSCLINQLPEAEEFESILESYAEADDYDGYEAYYEEIYRLVSKAYVNYENLLPHFREQIPNREHLFSFEWLYSGISLMSVTETRAVEFVNYYDNATANKTVLIHSGKVSDYSSFGFYWWYAVVVDENQYGELVVTGKYGYELTNKGSLAPTSSRGFVLLSHGDANAFDCDIGDEVTVDFNYLSSSGKNTSGFGTVTFSEYVPPVTEPDNEPVVEDIPLSDIQNGELSDTQVTDAGGITASAEGDVEISKSIDGTDIENVFDITLTVRTESSVQSYLEEPDMAVVIVMDISNTMNDKYPSGSSTSRYDAAVDAATDFMLQFAGETDGLSKVGFVAFNTNAHKIFDLSPCGSTAEAQSLINEMVNETSDIIDNYVTDDRTRFTNVEAGLKMGYDMLAESNNANKYIVFLSDGFPTTYYNPSDSDNTDDFYAGYETYTSSGTKGADGVFYDYVTGYYCSYGTSYSDKASIRAREAATQIKELGANIFSIGIDVGGQTIAGYERTGLSVIDRTSTSYEIGDASSTSAYQNWLKYSIGSGYYYDSTAKNDIAQAFSDIFTEIKNLNQESRYTIWTSTDPLPVFDEGSAIVEFIQFYDLNGQALTELNGNKNGEGLENNAVHRDGIIYWDLKYSGYSTSEETVGDITTTYYYYSLTYRVRLYNEAKKFEEYLSYDTNGNAYLEYKTIVDENGLKETSELKILEFEKPSVEGYYTDFDFFKKSPLGEPVEGAVFTLTHDDEACSICNGNGIPVTSVSILGPFTSDAVGSVYFPKIPSGHIYTLEETVVPEGYLATEKIYKVTVSLDELSVRVYESAEDTDGTLWQGDKDFIFTNEPYTYILPETGGTGTLYFTLSGCVIIMLPTVYGIISYKRKRKSDK